VTAEFEFYSTALL